MNELAASLDRPPMNAAEVIAFCELIVAYTERNPDENLLEVWGTQAAMGRWTFAEASRALHAWFHNHPDGQDYLKPKILGDMIRAARQDQALRAEAERARTRVAEIEAAREHPESTRPGEPSTDEFRRQMIAGIAADLGWDTAADAVSAELRETALAVACPHCQAPPGQFCHVLSRPDRRLAKRGAHPSRVELLEAGP